MQQTKIAILEAIKNIGTDIPTIKEIEQHVDLERHALGRTLHEMEQEGTLYHKNVGKAKIWFINEAPLHTILTKPTTTRTYAEELLFTLLENIPLTLIIINEEYTIEYTNKQATNNYGIIAGQKLYVAITGTNNPLQLRTIRNVVEKKQATTTTTIKDTHNNTITINARRITKEPHKDITILLIKKTKEEQP